ncbi:2-amino-4-hydroxy-6-hydroxymethyldihydropteridine diphosphokinase [Enterococcus timonensis]|uniref:2-amino-4-hydroxy-6- hydroxymethyldihydropteridine diphosphokinase n=1 Tax=Enterococcus timonensis TaxID=1852364 RepID=UPI0008D9D8EC|nr:2-amino-4-hydroxy-6-hydroxymethyldihydropteridine diphosphokinase [Enterococcus timonensis]
MKGYIALGSNLGDRLKNLQTARDYLLAAGIEVLAQSAIYETKAYGVTDQADFLNAVLAVETFFAPLDLLAETQKIEQTMGRVKLYRWGPRNIDLDILLLGEISMVTPSLNLPHIELTKRSFVLIPLADVYSEKLLLGETIEKWIQQSGNAQEVKKWGGATW